MFRVKRDTLCVLHFTIEKIGYENPHIATVALRYGVKTEICCDFLVFLSIYFIGALSHCTRLQSAFS